jgi:hypothetical protein
MSKIAHCACGALRAEVSGEPRFVAACHCEACQRRTGSVFNVSAYYRREQVRVEGREKVYIRDGQDGRKVRNRFCPDCGTTVYWDLDMFPDTVAIAVGAFFDPEFAAPSRSVYEQSKHHWVVFDHTIQNFSRVPIAAR